VCRCSRGLGLHAAFLCHRCHRLLRMTGITLEQVAVLFTAIVFMADRRIVCTVGVCFTHVCKHSRVGGSVLV
jgi:hypothetical protein